MAHGSFFTNVLFRLLNLGILLGFLIYIIKKYLIRNLKNELEAYHANNARLNETLHMQKGKAAHVHRNFSEREQLFETLKNRAERWHTIVQREQEKNIIEKKELRQKVERTLDQTFYQQALNQTKNLYMDQALVRAEQLLKDHYKHTQAQDTFIAECLNTLAENVP